MGVCPSHCFCFVLNWQQSYCWRPSFQPPPASRMYRSRCSSAKKVSDCNPHAVTRRCHITMTRLRDDFPSTHYNVGRTRYGTGKGGVHPILLSSSGGRTRWGNRFARTLNTGANTLSTAYPGTYLQYLYSSTVLCRYGCIVQVVVGRFAGQGRARHGVAWALRRERKDNGKNCPSRCGNITGNGMTLYDTST